MSSEWEEHGDSGLVGETVWGESATMGEARCSSWVGFLAFVLHTTRAVYSTLATPCTSVTRGMQCGHA